MLNGKAQRLLSKALHFRTAQGAPGTGDASIYLKKQKTELQKSQARWFFFFTIVNFESRVVSVQKGDPEPQITGFHLLLSPLWHAVGQTPTAMKQVEGTLAGDGDTNSFAWPLPCLGLAALKPEGALVALFKEAPSSVSGLLMQNAE